MLLLVKLTFKSALRIGSGELSQGDQIRGIVHSDQIFSAFANEWVKIMPKGSDNSLEKIIKKLQTDSPPFKISSAFPYYATGYYLPTPFGTDKLYKETLKDVSFLELYDFIDLANGNRKPVEKKQLSNPLDDMLFNFNTPRVTIDRITSSTNFYQGSGWLIKEGGGLYFLIDLIDESLFNSINLCLKVLEEYGIGGDKSIGYGSFTSEIKEIDGASGWKELFQKRQSQDTCYYSLSLCCPEKEEAKRALSYALISRKGWIMSSSSLQQMKRRECKMFAEGSLFKNPLRGVMADVTPSEFKDHRVYRYGLGMMVEFKK